MHRRIRTLRGGWISLKTAERLHKRGQGRWHGEVFEVLLSLDPAELNLQLALSPRVKAHSVSFDPVVHHANATNQHAVDLQPALPVSPEWLRRMGYDRQR